LKNFRRAGCGSRRLLILTQSAGSVHSHCPNEVCRLSLVLLPCNKSPIVLRIFSVQSYFCPLLGLRKALVPWMSVSEIDVGIKVKPLRCDNVAIPPLCIIVFPKLRPPYPYFLTYDGSTTRSGLREGVSGGFRETRHNAVYLAAIPLGLPGYAAGPALMFQLFAEVTPFSR